MQLITLFSGRVWFLLPRSFKDWVVSQVRSKPIIKTKRKRDYHRIAILNNKNVSARFSDSLSLFKCFRSWFS
nr:MAG: 3x protein [Ferret coronavirus]